MNNKQILVNLCTTCNLNCSHCFLPMTGIHMPKETLVNAINFIKKEIENKQNHYTVIFMGGEILIYKYLWDLIDLLDTLPHSENLTLCAQTNLTNEIDRRSNQFFYCLDEVYTSFDHKIRFKDFNHKILWLNNIETLKKDGIILSCTTCLTRDFITDIKPEFFIDFMLGLGMKNLELERLFEPFSKKDSFNDLLPTNREQENWLFDAFKYYYTNKISEYMRIDPFECIIDSIRGENYHEHSRTCQENNMAIQPNGDLCQCISTNCIPFGNINSGFRDLNVYNQNVLAEKEVNHLCLDCKYYKYCKGDCCVRKWDMTGCPTPKKIYEYLLTQE